jgi:hypothetical protein
MDQNQCAGQARATLRPTRFGPSELKKVGVELLGGALEILLRCSSCGATWSPELVGGRNLPRGYWRCPKGCNKQI